jgi:hypothetical protein
MKSRRSTSDWLSRWVDEGIDVAPDRPVQSALATIENTRQRRELALLRRIPLMDTVARREQRQSLSVALGLAALVILVAGLAALYGSQQRVGSQLPPAQFSGADANVIVSSVGTPSDVVGAGQRTVGATALAAVSATTGVPEMTALAELSQIAATSWASAPGNSRTYVAAALVFLGADGASRAIDILRSGAGEGLSPDGLSEDELAEPGRWFVVPWVNDASHDFRNEGFGLLASQAVVGGTSADEGSRAGMLLVWRVDNLVLVVAGSDWVTHASTDRQRQTEREVELLAQQLNDLAR